MADDRFHVRLLCYQGGSSSQAPCDTSEIRCVPLISRVGLSDSKVQLCGFNLITLASHLPRLIRKSMDSKVHSSRESIIHRSCRITGNLQSFQQCNLFLVPSFFNPGFSSDIDHGRLKRILGTGFTNTALAAVEQNIKEHTMRLCRRLAFEGRRREPVNLAKWFACFSLDVDSCVFFG